MTCGLQWESRVRIEMRSLSHISRGLTPRYVKESLGISSSISFHEMLLKNAERTG
jgi:hypothetical protein